MTNGRLVILSTPWGQSGKLWELYRQHYGRADSDTLVIGRRMDAGRVDRHDLAVQCAVFVFAVHGNRAGDEPGRVDHVRSTARMQYRFCIRQ